MRASAALLRRPERAAVAAVCVQDVPAVLQVRRSGTWTRVARTRTGARGRFTLPVAPAVAAQRVRLPAVMRDTGGGAVRCAAAARRLAGAG